MGEKHARHRKRKKTNYLRVLFILICLATIIFSGFHIIKWMKENKKSKENKNKIQESVTVDGDELLVDFDKLKEENSDTVAWLKVEGTDIEYPSAFTHIRQRLVRHANYGRVVNGNHIIVALKLRSGKLLEESEAGGVYKACDLRLFAFKQTAVFHNALTHGKIERYRL